MGIKQLYNDNLRKLPSEYGDVSVMIYKRVWMAGGGGEALGRWRHLISSQ